jgi:hypothetical protein
MDECAMIDLAAFPVFIILPACFIGGLFIGYGYFRALRETPNLIVSGGQPLRAAVLTLGRISLLTTGFFIVVLAGGAALLASLAGVLCARWIMLRKVRETST